MSCLRVCVTTTRYSATTRMWIVMKRERAYMSDSRPKGEAGIRALIEECYM